MRRYLVVANQTQQRGELRDELCKRTEAEPSPFYLLVPDTPAADYPDVPAAADLLQRGMTWRATDYRGPGQRSGGDRAGPATARPDAGWAGCAEHPR